jgi:hypothetical protein
MAMVPKYTNRASVPGSTGMQPVSLSLASSPLEGVGEGMTKVAVPLEAAAGRIQNREDLINSQRATELFLQNEDMEVEKFIKDPNTDLLTTGSVKPYTDAVQQRVQKYLDSYSLSPDGKAKLSAELSGLASTSIRNMLKRSLKAQDDFSIGNAVAAARSVRSQFDTLPPTADNIISEVNAATNAIIENSSNLSSPKARELIRQETEKVYVSGFDKVFATDDLKAAEDFVNSKNFRKNVTDVQLRSAITSIQTEKKERGAALRKAKVKFEVFKFFNKREPTKDEALQLSEVAGVKPESRGEFRKLLDDALNLESQFSKEELVGNSKYQMIKKRLEHLTRDKDGLSINLMKTELSAL